MTCKDALMQRVQEHRSSMVTFLAKQKSHSPARRLRATKLKTVQSKSFNLTL